jgi:UDP:flavonoid glycosyltransferase YjiC (YdhE family)
MISATYHIAYFISPHGFGHAARASAVMNALNAIHPEIKFHIFTSVPEWFFASSNNAPFTYHHAITDVGVVQSSAFVHNLNETLRRLEAFYPVSNQFVNSIANTLLEMHCQAVICDIAPLGIILANYLGLPSFLIENFTWDWIYEPYLTFSRRFEPMIKYLRNIYSQATWHIQTVPFCDPNIPANLRVSPVSRIPRASPDVIKEYLHTETHKKIILITMGGFGENTEFPAKFGDLDDVTFVIPGSVPSPQVSGNLIHIPFQSGFHYPDLINASDLVIGKAGYSTLAEIYHSGIPFGVIHRDKFRETPVLEEFILNQMKGALIDYDTFINGNWINKLSDLLQLGKFDHDLLNGADMIANFIEQSLLNP